MTLRKFLLLPLLLSLLFFIYFSRDLGNSLTVLFDTIHLTGGLMMVVLLAFVLQICGHIIRAYKARIIFGVAKESSTRFQFRALSLGYLFNTLLPFRIGELVRARVISGAMTISFGYALTLIVFERLVDALILGILGISIILINPFDSLHVTTYITTLFLIALIGLIFYSAVVTQNKYILLGWYKFTRLFNKELETSLRFKAWTVIYGLQRTLRLPILLRYAALSIASWLFYLTSLYILADYLLGRLSLPEHLTAASAPYYGMSVPAGPASLGVFSKVVNNFTSHIVLATQMKLSYNLIAWSILIVPIAVIGLVLLFSKTKEALWYKPSRSDASVGSLSNKLYRSEDISGEMKVFLEQFFSGNTLSRIVHTMELQDDFKLVRYFKGGSDAITILALQDGDQVVKKIIPHKFEDRLQAQHDWLIKYGNQQGVVSVLSQKRTADYYSIDLEYDENNEMFLEYIHKNTVQKSQRILDDVWHILDKNLYDQLSEQKLHTKERAEYIKKHIFGCLEKAAAVDVELARAVEPDKIIINGVEYDNLAQIMKKIESNKQAWKDIANYRESTAVHGDVIVDNLLVSHKTGKVLIIDPAPDGNIIQGPVFDFGKNMQSLYCGYETLLRDEDPVYLTDDNNIHYRDQKSDKYEKLAEYIQRELAPKYLTKSEQNAMMFHAATLYIRRLKHQVYYTPANALKFYAVGVKTFNEFLAQYDAKK